MVSDLPNNVIDIILSRVTLPIAVRTSALSKKWRLHWTRVENLMFCSDFNYQILRGCAGQDDEVNPSTYVGIVGNIRVSHSGPIRKFSLRVPYFGDDISDAINLWILSVSRHGVQDLTLHYFDSFCDYKVPSYVFQCTGLKHLSLTNVTNPPHNFEGLSSLLSLDLKCGVISGDLLTHIFLNCPLLERLSLSYCDDKCSFAIDASKLKSRRENRRNKCPDLIDFAGAVPKLEKLTLFSAVLEEWGVQDVPKLLPSRLENHVCLTVKSWNMYSLAQVRTMLCLINSLPTLQTLDIFSRSKSDSPSHVTSDYLKSLSREAENLWSLKTVKVEGLMGMEPELHFIELVLSCCPMLEELYLTSHGITADAEFKMMADIMRFRRASAQAEIIYSKFRNHVVKFMSLETDYFFYRGKDDGHPLRGDVEVWELQRRCGGVGIAEEMWRCGNCTVNFVRHGCGGVGIAEEMCELQRRRGNCRGEVEALDSVNMDGNRVKQITMLLDRISDLPNNVIDIILSRVPLRVAVRTSTLSKKWRIQWTRAENLVLDQNFFDDIFHGHVLESAFNRYIFDDIGPEDEILKSKYLGIVDAVNLWILAVLQHGVQDLKLHFERRICKVPSYVFQCMELKHLSLINLERSSLPHNFGGLSSLLSLDLHFDVISGGLLTHIFLNCPLLERLSLRFHRMDGYCAVNASELKEWGVQDVPKMLPAPLVNHLRLTVDYWNIYSLAQVRSMLCLINSSPKVQTLDIFAISEPDSPPHVTSDYLKSQIREAENLWSLKTVKIRGLNGDEPEMLFIELILSCCPVLEKLYLSSYSNISSGAELKLMRDIMRFPRASTQTEMIYS
ncbi:unnamed protein product [Rhodiola kirilowii]